MAAIAICTYRRPELLDAAVREIVRQINCLSQELVNAFQVRLVIIDNDPQKSAEQVFRMVRSIHSNIDCSYLVEAAPGVGSARNAAFREAGIDSALILFDDDQVPDRGWLSALLRRHQVYPNDVLVGPVTPLLPLDAPLWAERVGGWGARLHDDNATRTHAGFGNILLPCTALQSQFCMVPPAFLLGPGEDTVVTRMLSNEGFVLRTVREASAMEPVQADRITTKWLNERARASAHAWAKVLRHTGVPRVVILGYAANSMRRMFLAGVKMLYERGVVQKILFGRSMAVVNGYIDFYRNVNGPPRG